MPYVLGDDATAPPLPESPGGSSLATLAEQIAEIRKAQLEDARNRRLTVIIGGIGALFAAARLGVIALPLIQEKRRRRRRP